MKLLANISALMFTLIIGFSPVTAGAQTLSPTQIDSLAHKAITAFNVPGMSIAIVENGKVVMTKGYGVRSIQTKQKVDENTLFGIASNSKAFTTAAIGILVNDGQLKWDDKVIDYIPEFKLADPYITADFTIRDLLTHRSGLGMNAGDLMHNPDSSNFTIQDIIHNVRYLKFEAPFRSRYAYDNIFYLIAAELVQRVSGMSWGDFVKKRIMQPLQMQNSGASYVRVKHNADIIDAHREVNGKLEIFQRGDAENDAGAGGIYSSAADMAKWMLMQLNDGKYGPGLNRQLFSATIHKDMWTPQVVIPVGKPGVYNTHFGAYGLGWFLVDAKGYLEVDHTGQDDGMISEVIMFPELKLGITVLTNQEGGGAVRSVIDQLTDSYLGIKGVDHIAEYVDRIARNKQGVDTVTRKIWQQVNANKRSAIKINQSQYAGTYHDNWFGEVSIASNNGQLWFRSARSPQLRGPLQFYKGNTFVVKWSNPQMQVDAFVMFTLDEEGKAIGMIMKALSPNGAPGFDFQNLEFHKATQ